MRALKRPTLSINASVFVLPWGYRPHSTQRSRLESSKQAPPQPRQNPGLSPAPSLFEELFPEEARAYQETTASESSVPRQHQPGCNGVDVFPTSEQENPDLHSNELRARDRAKLASQNAFRQENLSVLALRAASKSLIESDFRRIAPKGKHIKHWTGPVIPVRDPATLEQNGVYFILFQNPANARAYQHHVLSLHHMAKTYTPTSIESPLPLQSGVVIDGEDAHALLRDYALCQPSRRLQVNVPAAPYGAGIKRLLEHGGYPQITEGGDKTGRAVLFWVDGQKPTTSLVEEHLNSDGRKRGMAWKMEVELLEPPRKLSEIDVAAENRQSAGYSDTDEHIRKGRRWIITFETEDEARRFIRAWHYSPFPWEGGEPVFARAELLW